jgi:hypothetical protein
LDTSSTFSGKDVGEKRRRNNDASSSSRDRRAQSGGAVVTKTHRLYGGGATSSSSFARQSWCSRRGRRKRSHCLFSPRVKLWRFFSPFFFGFFFFFGVSPFFCGREAFMYFPPSRTKKIKYEHTEANGKRNEKRETNKKKANDTCAFFLVFLRQNKARGARFCFLFVFLRRR